LLSGTVCSRERLSETRSIVKSRKKALELRKTKGNLETRKNRKAKGNLENRKVRVIWKTGKQEG